jgi:hypothetical protein
MAEVQQVLNKLKDVLPGPVLAAALTLNARLRPMPHASEDRQLFAELGRPSTVLGGPFKGMRYLTRARGSVLLAKLLGTYEMELHEAIETAIAWAPDVVVDVGSAEGYYAVGLATKLSNASIYAFDTDRYAQYLLRKLAAKNAVTNLTIGGLCTAERLQTTIQSAKRPLIVCDCEGFEDQLLWLDAAPGLAKAMVVVELHEAVVPGVAAKLRDRFKATHHVEEIFARPRTARDLPTGVMLSESKAVRAIEEGRPAGMSWHVMKPEASVV